MILRNWLQKSSDCLMKCQISEKLVRMIKLYTNDDLGTLLLFTLVGLVAADRFSASIVDSNFDTSCSFSTNAFSNLSIADKANVASMRQTSLDSACAISVGSGGWCSTSTGKDDELSASNFFAAIIANTATRTRRWTDDYSSGALERMFRWYLL